MATKGFVPLLLLIPVAIVSIISLTVATLKTNYNPNLKPSPNSISRSIENSPSSSPQQEEQKIEESPTPIPSPSIEPDLSLEYTAVAKEAPTPSPSPTPKPVAASSTTSGGNYTVATFNLGSITVVTDSANDNDCGNDCPTKPLAAYISENGGRAGINGTYFCPPDYSWCAGKVNTYDFPIWNNRNKKWMRADTLTWSGRGMMVFRGGSAQFFPCAACTGAPSDITGGIVNYPPLLSGGQDVLNEGSLSDNLRVTKGTRSGIGFGNGKLFLVVARSANMQDMVNIFKSLGATDALNLDGGGSSALFDGGYKAGPGRSLPNALIVK